MSRPGLLGKPVDRYLTEAYLGSGTFSAVYRARHVHTGAKVALKVLRRSLEDEGDDTVVERFLREARAAAAVGNDHIVQVVDAGRSAEGLSFVALEFLEGVGLDSLQQRGPMEPTRAVALCLQVLEALEVAHDKGIIHRDMKPANVFVIQRGGGDFVKLLDFGISKMHAEDVRSLTMTGVAMGTPTFMAPEQFVDASSVDRRADLYSVAVMLYQLLAGRKPLEATSYAEMVMKIRTETPPPLRQVAPGVSVALADCVMKGLEKDKARRWSSAADFKAALEAARTSGLYGPVARADADTVLMGPVAPAMPQQDATVLMEPAARGAPSLDLTQAPRSSVLAALAPVAPARPLEPSTPAETLAPVNAAGLPAALWVIAGLLLLVVVAALVMLVR